jgi:general secretion pathway protein J
VTKTQDLQEWWLRSQQWTSMNTDALKMLSDVSELQVYYYWNAWSNAQSTGDKTTVVTPPVEPTDPNTPKPPPDDIAEDQLPNGVRLVLRLPAGPLIRDLTLHASN